MLPGFQKAFIRPWGRLFCPGFTGGTTLPCSLLAYFTGVSDGEAVDKVGKDTRILYPLQSGLFVSGDYLTGDIAEGVTVIDSEGTSVITLFENKLACTAGTLWSFELSNGSTYEYPTKLSSTSAIWFDTSGNDRHLTLANDTTVDADSHCVESYTIGSDTVNQDGYTIADGNQYYDEDLTSLIPDSVIIPALADSSGCCAWIATPSPFSGFPYTLPFTLG